MLRHPVQLTSLEEDFKRLGLLQEDAVPAPQQKPAPPGVPGPNKNGSRNVGAQSEGDSDEGVDGNDTVPGHQGEPTGSGPTKPALPTTPGAQKESIAGGDSRRQRLRGEGKKDDEEDDDEDEDEDEIEKDESVELEGSSAVQESIRRLRGPRTESRRTPLKESKHAGRLDKVAALIEDVNSIMESIDNTRKEDAVRAFANSAIISEMLSKGFEHFAEEYDDQDFADTAQSFASMAEDAANIAHALEEGEDLDPEALQTEFRAQMDGLMEGLDLYSDVVEADSEVEDEEGLDEEEETEEQEEETEDDQEEETEGGQEEASSMAGSSYRPKFTGSKKKTGHVGTWSTGAKQQNSSKSEERGTRATGGIVSQRTDESYFRQGKMGPSGKKTAGTKR